MRTAIRLIPALAVALAVAACDSQKPAPKTEEAPKPEAPKAEVPKVEAPKAEAPKAPPADAAPKGEPSTTLPPKGEPSTTLPPKPPAGTAPAAPAAGEQVLFDGKTLKNWKVADFAGGGKVEVKDGAIVIGMGEPMTGIVWSGGEIPKMDYEITLEAKKVDGSDFFCALTFPYGKKSCTFVCGGWGGIVTGLSTIDGFDASDNETTNTKEFKANTWYKIRVRATEEEIECWINGEQLVDVETKEKQIDIRLECEPCVPMGVATFQTTGALRNMRMKKVN
jgi:hypothetical protein